MTGKSSSAQVLSVQDIWMDYRVQSRIKVEAAEARQTCPVSPSFSMETERTRDVWSYPFTSFEVIVLAILILRIGSNRILPRSSPTSNAWSSGKNERWVGTLSECRTALLTISGSWPLASRMEMVATLEYNCSLLRKAMNLPQLEMAGQTTIPAVSAGTLIKSKMDGNTGTRPAAPEQSAYTIYGRWTDRAPDQKKLASTLSSWMLQLWSWRISHKEIPWRWDHIVAKAVASCEMAIFFNSPRSCIDSNRVEDALALVQREALARHNLQM